MATAIQDQPVVAPVDTTRAQIPRDVRAAVDGAIGGLAGTVPMSAAMLAARRLGLLGRQPPERITQKVFFRGRRRAGSQKPRNMLATVLHFAFGGMAGAVYGVAQRRLPWRVSPILTGALFGTLLWASSYMGWIPALGLMPHAKHDRPDRRVIMVVAHWIFGATLGAVVGWLGRAAPDRGGS
ncbi:MAG TPA: DUF6789 family protein [Ktedonobacterales bacterium]|nr:DUF6789 family protein [Ktedonobacterales bacterium]